MLKKKDAILLFFCCRMVILKQALQLKGPQQWLKGY